MAAHSSSSRRSATLNRTLPTHVTLYRAGGPPAGGNTDVTSVVRGDVGRDDHNENLNNCTWRYRGRFPFPESRDPLTATRDLRRGPERRAHGAHPQIAELP
ncbi:hypothetical protein GCM10010424_67050 [Streptomyces lienomycini]